MAVRRSAGGWRKTVGGDGVEELFRRIKDKGTARDQLIFLCVGTDRSSGDSLGPLTGTWLREAGFPHVIGTLDQPCDADNWSMRLEELAALLTEEARRVVVAVDACLGSAYTAGMFQLSDGPLEPGRSMKLGLTPVGTYSIAAIVNENRANPYTVLQTTPLYRVWTMARQIVTGAQTVFPPDE